MCTSVPIPRHKHERLSVGIAANTITRRRRRRSFVVRAATSSSSSPDPDSSHKIAPLQFQSPIGQFLSQILINHPHLVPAAVDQQLLQLQSDRDVAHHQQNQDPSPTTSTDLVLYRFLPFFHLNSSIYCPISYLFMLTILLSSQLF